MHEYNCFYLRPHACCLRPPTVIARESVSSILRCRSCEPRTRAERADASAGLFAVLVSVAAILGGACEVLVRFKGASARRVATSGCFFVVCLGVAAAAAFCLARWLAG